MLNRLFTQRRLAVSSPLSHQDESPAEPTSASSARLILNPNQPKATAFQPMATAPNSSVSFHDAGHCFSSVSSLD